jgi:tellurite resistance protein TerC
MFLVLLVIESTDVIFAIDSVPAVIGIIPSKTFSASLTTFIAFTSNVFAILGLRALYFLLAGMVDLFRYLHYGLAGVLGFVGLKMIAEYWVPHDEGEHLMSPVLSLTVISLLLALSIVASLVAQHRAGPAEETPADGR